MQAANTTPFSENMQQKVEQFAGQVITDLAAAMAGVMTNLGHKLGLYRPWQRAAPSVRMNWRAAPRPMSAPCESGFTRRSPADMRCSIV